MTIMHPILLADIDTFLAETGMGEKYFGKVSAGNSEVVPRLRKGGRIWPETEAKIRAFMLTRQQPAKRKHKSSMEDIQGAGP